MAQYNLIATTSDSTVVAEYTPDKNRADTYQSEAALEQEFLHLLTQQGYEYLPIHQETDLVDNLRRQLEALNDYTFTDGEWKRFFRESIVGANDGIVEKTRRIQQDHVQVAPARQRGGQKHLPLRQEEHPQQPPPGDQPVRGGRGQPQHPV